MRRTASLLLALGTTTLATPAGATHLWSTLLRYRVPDPVAAPLSVEVVLEMGYRANYGTEAAGVQFSDGGSASDPGVLVASPALQSAPALPVHVARYALPHTFAAAAPASATYASCCAASTIENGADGSFVTSLPLPLSQPTLGSPVTRIPTVVDLQTAGLRVVPILVGDPNGGAVTCRAATSAESAFADAPPTLPSGATPGLADAPGGCTLTWDTTGAIAGKVYLATAAFETGPAGAADVTVATFLLQLWASPPPTCTGSGHFQVAVGETLALPFQGTTQSGTPLTVGTVGLLGTLSPADGTSGPAPMDATVTFSPGPEDVGMHAMNVVFVDGMGVSGACTAIVTVTPCPEYGLACSAGEGACSEEGILRCAGDRVECDAVPGTPSDEACNGLDDDCDGAADEDGVCDQGTGGAGGVGGAPGEGGAGAGGADEGGAPAGSRAPSEVGGCGCRVSGEARWGGPVGLAAGLALVLARRRRGVPRSR